MKNYFYQNSIIQLSYVPQGYVVSQSFNDRFNAFVELTQEQNDFYQVNPTANVFEINECRLISIEPTLPTLQERKAELIEKFKPVQDIFTNRLAKVSNILGENHDYILRLKTICRLRREQTLETILAFTTIEEAMNFDIRDSDMQPILTIMDIIENNPLSNTEAISQAGHEITQIEQYFGI